jgi:hypothetical protein
MQTKKKEKEKEKKTSRREDRTGSLRVLISPGVQKVTDAFGSIISDKALVENQSVRLFLKKFRLP